MRGSLKGPRRYPVVGMLAALALVGAVVPAGSLTPVKVVAEPGEQYWPSSNGEYVVWTDQDRNTVFCKRLLYALPGVDTV